MKQFFLLLLLSVFSLAAADFTVPRHTSWVVDEAQVFSKEEKDRILSAIQKLEKATDGGQMAVVTLKSLNGISIEEAGIKIADAWKVGNRGKDDGAILVIVPSERQMRLEIGYGWEGSINDARAGDIIRGLKPFFRAERYADGAVYAVGQVQKLITGTAPENVPEPPAAVSTKGKNTFTDYAIALVIAVLTVVLFVRCSGGDSGDDSGGGFFRGGGGGFSGGGGGRFGGGGASGRW